jgi:hypothetical protein
MGKIGPKSREKHKTRATSTTLGTGTASIWMAEASSGTIVTGLIWTTSVPWLLECDLDEFILKHEFDDCPAAMQHA